MKNKRKSTKKGNYYQDIAGFVVHIEILAVIDYRYQLLYVL